ncbi:MAG: TIGR02996 domain-containing protein [Polyangiaceae bacterium]|nr:TIGR02996 domain-containing protein [Polyangiaceae bacterium]
MAETFVPRQMREDDGTETGEGLLQAVLATPDDVAPRLEYADWLRARGNPRGELIFVQCALARLGQEEGGAERGPLLRRESELLRKHRRAWLEPIFGKRSKDCELERGFVWRVTMRAAEVAENLEAIRRVEPVRSVRVTNADLAPLVASRAAGLVRALDLRNVQLGARWARPLFEAETFTSLEELDLVLCHLGRKGAAEIEAAAPERLPALHTLHLANNALGDEGAAILARAPILANLRVLHLGMNGIGLDGARALVASPHLDHIERLVLWANPLTERGVRELRARFHLRLFADPDWET